MALDIKKPNVNPGVLTLPLEPRWGNAGTCDWIQGHFSTPHGLYVSYAGWSLAAGTIDIIQRS